MSRRVKAEQNNSALSVYAGPGVGFNIYSPDGGGKLIRRAYIAGAVAEVTCTWPVSKITEIGSSVEITSTAQAGICIDSKIAQEQRRSAIGYATEKGRAAGRYRE